MGGGALPIRSNNIGRIIMDPPAFDAQVQFHRLMTLTFAMADSLQQICRENIGPFEGQST